MEKVSKRAKMCLGPIYKYKEGKFVEIRYLSTYEAQFFQCFLLPNYINTFDV